MVGTILLCVFSTMMFCACVRGLMFVSTTPQGLIRLRYGGFSASARRLARQYIGFALATLGLLSFAGVVSSFIELFQFQF